MRNVEAWGVEDSVEHPAPADAFVSAFHTHLSVLYGRKIMAYLFLSLYSSESDSWQRHEQRVNTFQTLCAQHCTCMVCSILPFVSQYVIKCSGLE